MAEGRNFRTFDDFYGDLEKISDAMNSSQSQSCRKTKGRTNKKLKSSVANGQGSTKNETLTKNKNSEYQSPDYDKIERKDKSSDESKSSTKDLSSDESKISTKDLSSDESKISTKDLPSDESKISTKDLPSDKSKISTKDLPSDKSKISTKDLPSDESKISTKDLSSDESKTFTKDLPSDKSKISTKDLPSDESKISTKDLPSDKSKISTKDLPSDKSKISTKDLSSDESKISTKDLPSDESKASTKDHTSDKSKAYTKDLSSDESKISTKDLPSDKSKISTKDLPSDESKASTKDHTSNKSKASTENKTSETNDESKTFGVDKSNDENVTSSYVFMFHKKWAGGPPPRLYRRSYQEAKEIEPEMCPDGKKIKRLENEVMSSPSNVCKFCKKKSPEALKRCTRCQAVSYCDKDCQIVDFNNHKLFCRRCDRYDIARARVYPALPIFYNLRHGGDYTVLLREMPLEFDYNLGATRCNILLEFLGRFEHPYRYACYVRDLSGETRKIVFPDQSNLYCHPIFGEPSAPPRDLASCLKPGHFLLLVGVHWRFFSDGTVGIRVNDLKSMYIIDMADQHLSKTYKANMANMILVEELLAFGKRS
ncbi:LPXTG-motif cell wall anchor domain protein [Plakobranchus ocellatus]|uniref:LPXTG-motif cell wall anchor domain protein n=1 Tax=Plakobranchus ocellatus TaxID=259542 RepID=A0AAV3XY00_9GAST|nr:LPXTG-motif cell wall anchor domain protein [Plakobranchus ocellatus]